MEVKSWMANNFLKLNDEKTEFIMLGAKNDLEKVSERIVTVGNEEVLPSYDCAEYWGDVRYCSHHEVPYKYCNKI